MTIEGQEGCVCGHGQDTIKQLTQQVAFLQQQLQKIQVCTIEFLRKLIFLQSGMTNNPSNPVTHKAASFTAGIQNSLEEMQF